MMHIESRTEVQMLPMRAVSRVVGTSPFKEKASMQMMPMARRLRVVGTLVALVALMSIVGCESMDRAESIRTMNKGLEAYQLGNTIEAVGLLKQAGQTDPSYAEPPYYLGQLYHMKLDEPDNAMHYYREALTRDEENPQIAYRLGTVMSEQGKWEEAQTYLSKATVAKPDFAKAWFRLGLAHNAERQYPEAVEAYMKSIESNARMKMDEEDDGGAAYHALGDLYIRFELFDKAIQVYENALENNEDVPRLRMGLGVAQLNAEKYAEAESNFSKALELDGSMSTAVFNRGVAFMQLGRTEDAVKAFQEYSDRANPEKESAQITAAQGFVQQIKEAQEAAEEK
jgi:superkiller protein 3